MLVMLVMLAGGGAARAGGFPPAGAPPGTCGRTRAWSGPGRNRGRRWSPPFFSGMCEKTVVIKKPGRFAPAAGSRPPAAGPRPPQPASQPGQGDHELCDSLPPRKNGGDHRRPGSGAAL